MSYTVEQIQKNPWLLLQDLIGKADRWPLYIRRMFWDKDLTDVKRLKLVSFCYQNGVSEYVLHSVLERTIKESYTADRRRQIKAKYKYFDDPIEGYNRREKAYALDLIKNKVLTFNGNERLLR